MANKSVRLSFNHEPVQVRDLLWAYLDGDQKRSMLLIPVVQMRFGGFVLIALMALANVANGQDIYLLSKRETLDTTNTLVVLFHDKGVTTMDDCQREILRGNRDQWRFYHHSFPRPTGYSQNRDYLCINAGIKVDPWNKDAPYDNIYQIDVRTEKVTFKKMPNLAACLGNLRSATKAETRRFFCGKLSQLVK